MEPKFNLNRPKISDEEINKHKDFDNLVKQFKQQSIQKAKSDSSFLKNKKATYATVIAGIAVVCTVTYFTVFNKQNKQTATNDKTNTLTEDKKIPSTKKAFIAPPSKKLDVPYTTYKVNSTKGGELAHHTNSKIKVPKSAFVNKEGKEIVGDVEILYREFHNQADIIASGIPMQYDSAGTKYTFESAGMFDVKGYQNGEEVYLKQGKPITIELASQYPDDKYNQYYLDTVTHNWQVIKHDTPLINPNVQTVAKAEPATTPKVISQLTKRIEHVPIKIDSVKTVYEKKITTLASPKQPAKPAKAVPGKPVYQLDPDYKEFPELLAFKNAVFEVGSENKNYSKELSTIEWSGATISPGPQKGKNYLLTLTKKTREEKLIVYPVLTGADYEKAAQVYENKFTEYNAALDKRQADELKLKSEMEAKQKAYMEEQKKLSAELLKEQIRIGREMEAQYANQNKNFAVQQTVRRVFEINKFGIYNSDCPRSMPHGPVIEPRYSSAGVPLEEYLGSITGPCGMERGQSEL